jgi:hypothetical protein
VAKWLFPKSRSVLDLSWGLRFCRLLPRGSLSIEFLLVLLVMEFEHRVSHLLGRCSTS